MHVFNKEDTKNKIIFYKGSLQWVQWLGRLESWITSLKKNLDHSQVVHLLIHLRVPSLQPSRATSLAAQGVGMVGILLGPPELLQKTVLEKPSITLVELENQIYYVSGSRGVNTPSAEPQRDYSFYRQTVVGNTSC